jgi:PIN domain nuclease of toxin-antitoxin system
MGCRAVILLDTHVWIWAIEEPERIPTHTFEVVRDQDVVVASTISCWEIAMLVAKKRVKLSADPETWIRRAMQVPAFELEPLSAHAARLAGSDELDWPHGDPSDRMIVATAFDLDIPLVTADRQIQSIPGLNTLW